MRLSPHKIRSLAFLIPALLLFPVGAFAQDYVGNGNVTIRDGSWDDVYGLKGQPRTGNALAESARLVVSGATINKHVYGAYARSDSSTARVGGNTVVITGLQGSAYAFYGGYANSRTGNAVASANALSMGGTLVTGAYPQAYGGYATTSGATGGYILATNNRVTLGNGVSLDLAAGGRSRADSSSGTATGAYGNVVTVTGGSVASLYGGWATGDGTAEASGNTLAISGGKVGSVTGAEAHSYSREAVADGNVVSINGGTHGVIIAASVQSNTAEASASNNAVYLSHTTVGGVTGGLSTNQSSPSRLDRNSIVIGAEARVMGDVHGGDANQQTTTGGNSASYNTIAVVEGGQVNGELVGGNLNGPGSTSHNTILVNNGSANGDIIGGRTAAGGSANGNSIIIGRQARLATGISLFGGETGGKAVASRGSGNTLFVDSWQGTVQRAAGFANLHFVLPVPGTPVAGVPMLTVTSAEADDFDGTTVTAQLPDIITGGRAHLGETFELLHDDSGAVAKADTGGLVSLLQGYAVLYDGAIFRNGDSIYIRIDGYRPNPLAGALTQARIGAAGLLNQGGDLLAGTALRAADTAARETTGWAAFAAVYGGTASLGTESDITMRGLSLITGLAHRYETARADMLLGAFFEAGTAGLTTTREAAGQTATGCGSAQYTGGGLLARLDITRGLLRGLHAEASGRAGEAQTSWYSDDLLDNLDRPAAYDLSLPYYGGHVGLGYAFPLAEAWTLDIYGKYLFLHQDGQDTTINGDTFRFDAVDSGRLRCGARLSGAVLPSASVYLGAAWEQELFGTARAVSLSSGMSAPSADMAGSSGIFELGLAVHPAAMPVHLDLAVEGAAGTRRGIGGHVQLVYEF